MEEMAGQFSAELLALVPDWKQRLLADPSHLPSLEQEVHTAFARGADLLSAGLMALVMKQPEFAAASEQTRSGYRSAAGGLARGRERTIRVRLLGGLVLWVTSLYCAPRRPLGRRPEEEVSGLYVELAQFGCGKGVTPALESRVARQAALCPSLESAQQELERNGLKLDVKTVGRITYQCGESLLGLRKYQLLAWREGKLPAGTELHGKRVTVQIDGGRTRIRGPLRPALPQPEPTDAEGFVLQNAPGRSKKRPTQTYDADWREPKLVTIFVHDEQGRMVKRSRATLEGTFLGPDALAELVAMHLHRLGAAGAQSITFVSDGAPWIWDRVKQIVSLAKLDHVKIHEVLDVCHAAHHISLALATQGLNTTDRMPLYREHRTLLRNGQWRRVVEELTDLAENEPGNEKMRTEIAYLRKHGEAGRLSYPHYRALGLPLGSGAVESSIRRVINLRLKGNGMFWRERQAEAMLQVRAQVISNRWDDRLGEMRDLSRRQARTNWRWEPQAMSVKSECAPTLPRAP
ncbi:MAG: hypothetical protein ACREDH_01585 [Methylocella sp.]